MGHRTEDHIPKSTKLAALPPVFKIYQNEETEVCISEALSAQSWITFDTTLHTGFKPSRADPLIYTWLMFKGTVIDSIVSRASAK